MTAPGEGWPTLADVHAAVLRVDGRLQAAMERQDAQARELAQHRAEDRRELDGLWSRTEKLQGRERWLAGGMAGVGALLLLVGAPLAAHLVGLIGG